MTPSDPIPPWARDAARLPLAFAQVREDAELDLAIADRLPADASVIMVASGGCTAAALARHPRIKRLHLVDPNPAQLAITRLKLRLLESPLETRLRVLGHSAMESRLEAIRRAGVEPETLGPPDVIESTGPDHAGRYESTFQALREAIRLGDGLDDAFRKVMRQDILVHLFGSAATGNRRRDFADHFIERTHRILGTSLAARNPYLSQVLEGRYSTPTPWLELQAGRATAQVEETLGTMQDALASADGEVDFIHASNILDWLEPPAAARLLESAARALRPGGWILIRQLNSTLDIRALGDRIAWDESTSQEFLDRDRSFFYSALHAGVRR